MLMTCNFQTFITNNLIKVLMYFVSHFCNSLHYYWNNTSPDWFTFTQRKHNLAGSKSTDKIWQYVASQS